MNTRSHSNRILVVWAIGAMAVFNFLHFQPPSSSESKDEIDVESLVSEFLDMEHENAGHIKNGCQSNSSELPFFTNYPRYHALREIVEIKNWPKDVRYIVCEWNPRGILFHPAHFMQQMTRCISLWETFDQLEPVFLSDLPMEDYRIKDKYPGEMMSLLNEIYHLRIIQSMDDIDRSQAIHAMPTFDKRVNENPINGFAMITPRHAELFREKTWRHYNRTVVGCHQISWKVPRIAILHRHATRRLTNVESLQKALSDLTGSPVEIKYFENATFREQIDFISSIDIVISPHGAQLTSLLFMSTCGGVVEYFPAGYYYPIFFASLAAASGLQHAYEYTGQDRHHEWFELSASNLQMRKEARSRDICVPIEGTIKAVNEMIYRWNACCRFQSDGRLRFHQPYSFLD